MQVHPSGFSYLLGLIQGKEAIGVQITNLNKKRVCDLSNDKRVVQIRRGDCVTFIRANRDGTLHITHIRDKKEN